ncbi:MAG: hypothetical protein L0G82_17305, partial [Pseudomonas sp.]|nr:hypothetical protein [Pseudomonas sp.]
MPTSRDLLADLIAFDTTSRESNLALIDYVRAYLAGLGIDSELLFNAERSKANLYARIGPAGAGGVMGGAPARRGAPAPRGAARAPG